MNNAEYMRLLKAQRERAKMDKKSIDNALKLDPEPEAIPEPESVPDNDTKEVNDNESIDDRKDGNNAPD